MNPGGRDGCDRFWIVERANKPVSARRNGFDIARSINRIIQGTPQAIHSSVQPMVEIHKRLVGPDLISQLLASHDLAGAGEQNQQHLERLARQFDSDTTVENFPCGGVYIVRSKFESDPRFWLRGHSSAVFRDRSIAWRWVLRPPRANGYLMPNQLLSKRVIFEAKRRRQP
jgi:hypothetical protein